jgi:hypothetical protein
VAEPGALHTRHQLDQHLGGGAEEVSLSHQVPLQAVTLLAQALDIVAQDSIGDASCHVCALGIGHSWSCLLAQSEARTVGVLQEGVRLVAGIDDGGSLALEKVALSLDACEALVVQLHSSELALSEP